MPELRGRLERFEDLAIALAQSAESAFRLTLGPSLRAYDEGGRPARLLIVIDQMEELFTHAAGRRDLVPALSRAALAAGADGLIVEVHPEPEQALSDGAQSLNLQGFAALMRDLPRRIA